ncbi:MAG: electron transfer flavoprotein subunit beta/FixA family protein [Elusimicrobia bacterium]|nr:electron transfer flavoprotein subunit beta/FixA family protein [Elusimicrobiota bacterium]
MKIIVCIKQVPDTTEVKINPETGTLIRTGVPSILNPYDHFALESALNLKKKHPGFTVDVISMGPPQAKAVVQFALALGADEGILLSDAAFAGSDTWATSYALSMAIKKIGKADMIFCGMQAIDGDTAQVGPGIAQQLGLPQVTFCEHIEVEGKTIIAERHIDGGSETVELRAPALFTMIMPKDHPYAYPSFTQIYSASKKKFSIWNAQDIGAESHYLGLKGSPTQVSKIYPPKKETETQFFNVSAAEAAEKIVEIMKKEGFIK